MKTRALRKEALGLGDHGARGRKDLLSIFNTNNLTYERNIKKGMREFKQICEQSWWTSAARNGLQAGVVEN